MGPRINYVSPFDVRKMFACQGSSPGFRRLLDGDTGLSRERTPLGEAGPPAGRPLGGGGAVLLGRPKSASILKSYRLCPQPRGLGMGWVTFIPAVPVLKGAKETSADFNHNCLPP